MILKISTMGNIIFVVVCRRPKHWSVLYQWIVWT
jgi:hypothetical protein